MLKPIEYCLPDVNPFIRNPEQIELIHNFESKYGEEFCERIARAVNELAETRPIDPITPFVDAFRKEPIGEVKTLQLPQLDAKIVEIGSRCAFDSCGQNAFQICIRSNDVKSKKFTFPVFFHQIFDASSKLECSPEEIQFRVDVMQKTAKFIEDWFREFTHTTDTCTLSNFLIIDKSLTQYFDAKTIIPETPPKPVDNSGKNAKKPHPALKLPWPPKPKLLQRIKFRAFEDGFVAISMVSLAVFSFIQRSLGIPVRQLIRVVGHVIAPETQWPVAIPTPFLSVFTSSRKPVGKLKFLQEIMVTPQEDWEPKQYFTAAASLIENFRKKMFVKQNARMSSRGSMSWGIDKITEAFNPLQKLLDEEVFSTGLGVSLNTQEISSHGFYEVKYGKQKKPEVVLKILDGLLRRYCGMVSVFNPVHPEHRDKLIPFCTTWTPRCRRILLFHEDFANFHETLKTFPRNFRGALISLKAEDTLTSLIEKIAAAQALNIPICLQNSTGFAFEDSALLLDIAIGLGLEYIKFEAPGRPEMNAVVNRYLDLGTSLNDIPSPETFGKEICVNKLEHISTEHKPTFQHHF